MDRGEPSMSNTVASVHKVETSSPSSASDDLNPASSHLHLGTQMQNAQSDLFSSDGPELMSPFPADLNLTTFDSPIDPKVNNAHPSLVGDAAPISTMMMSAAHPLDVGSMGSAFPQRHDNLGTAEPWSPTGSREQLHLSDESLPRQAGEKKKATKIESQEDDERPPAWSELKTKAGKERKRLPLACIACRRKKIRCSGEKPACKHCLRSRIPCVYKVTTRKAAPRTDYMAMLDKRLKRMEERVIKVIPKDELPDMAMVGRAVVRPALPTQLPKPNNTPVNKKRSADEAFTDELKEWTKSKGQHGISESILKRQQTKRREENTLLSEGADFLPSMELQEHLAEVFFDCIYGQSYLLLHKPSFMRKLKAGNVPPVLALAVCAISARFSTHPEVSTEPSFLRGESWASPARAIIEQRHYEPNITILTVMLILGLHYFGTCEGGLSWSFGGQAMRMAYALQLHKETDYDPLGRKKGQTTELSFTDREIRRRTFWACFLMDRFNASGTERPPFGNEEFIHIQLPIKESYFQMEISGPTEDLDGGVPNPITPGDGQLSDPEENLGVAAYVIRAISLWGRIVKYLNLGGKEKDKNLCWSPQSGFAALQHEVRHFNENLPPLLAFSQENLQNYAAERMANQFLYLHIVCQHNTLFLNRFAIPSSPGVRPPRDVPKDFLNECGKMVIEAASQISTLIDASSGHLLTVPFAGYCAYAASTVHVWGIFSKQPQLEAVSKENLRHSYKYLNKMKKYWGIFHYMAESIKDVYRAFADAALKGTSTPRSGIGQAMFQYGDWFDKYPHGVSHSDWEDTDNKKKKETGTEAVMSHQSELQSVEEFFASLSPPSKSDNPRKAARRSTKTTGEGTRSKKQPNRSDSSTSQGKPTVSHHTVDEPTLLQNHHLTSHPVSLSDPALLPPDQSPSSFPPQSVNTTDFDLSNHPPYPPSFYPHQLNQLDRQIVFGAYAGLEPSTVSLDNFHGGNNSFEHYWEGVDLNGMNTNNQTTSAFTAPGYFGGANDPSSAWFMPFNMDPPEIGRDSMRGLQSVIGAIPGFGGVGNGDGNGFSTQGPPGPSGQEQHPQSGPDQTSHGMDIDIGLGDPHDLKHV